MITRSAILGIATEEQLNSEFEAFESTLDTLLKPLREKLEQSIMGMGNAPLLTHLVFVESWRDRVGRYFSLAYMFVEHCKSSTFSPPAKETGKITDKEREAYQKRLSSGFSSVHRDLENMIGSIDSRVNLCKKIMDFDARGLNNSRV